MATSTRESKALTVAIRESKADYGAADRTPIQRQDEEISSGQIILGLMGAGSILIYVAPGIACAAVPACGGWLAATFPSLAPVVFVSGGIDSAGMGLLFGIRSYDMLVENFIYNPASRLKRGAMVVLISANILEKLLTAIGTNAGLLLSSLIVCSAVPGSVYGAVRIVLVEMPYVAEALRDFAQFNLHSFYLSAKNNIFGLFLDERIKRNELKDLLQKREVFLEILHQKYMTLLEQADTLEFDSKEHPLTALVKLDCSREVVLEEFKDKRGARAGSNVTAFSAGLSLGTVTASPYIYNVFKNMLIFPWARFPATGLVCASITYAILKFCLEGMGLGFQLIKSVMRGEPIPSVSFQLRPKATMLMLLLNVGVSLWSYAVVDMLVNNKVSDENPLKNTLGWVASLGIDLVHFVSLIHLWLEGITRMTNDERLRYMLRVERELEARQRITMKEFLELVEVEVKRIEDKKTVLDFRLLKAPEEKPAFKRPKPVEESSTWSFSDIFCCCRRRNKAPEPVKMVVTPRKGGRQ